MDGTLDSDILQQQIHSVVRQRHEILQMEVELKAQIIARTEMMEMRSTFDAQLKEHANNANKFQVCIQAFVYIDTQDWANLSSRTSKNEFPQVLPDDYTFRCLVVYLYNTLGIMTILDA